MILRSDVARGGSDGVGDQGAQDLLVREVLLVCEHRKLPRHRRKRPTAERAHCKKVLNYNLGLLTQINVHSTYV